MKTKFLPHLCMTIFALSAMAAMIGCQKNATPDLGLSSQSAINIYLTDDPSLSFEQLWLDIQKLEIKAEDDTQLKHENEHQGEVDDNDKKGDNSGGWIPVSINAGVYNILQFRNGLDTLFGNLRFPSTRHLKKIRLTLGNKNSAVLNGVTIPLSLNGNDHFIVLKLDDASVKFTNGGANDCWIDIDAGQSVKKQGNNFELKPAVKLFSKDVTGRIEGRVLPADAKPVVTVINATDTAVAMPEREGEFKVGGLKQGIYSVIYHATAGNYADTTLKNILVRAKEDTKLPDISLRK